MNDLLLFLTSKEIMIVYLLILVIAALAIVVWLIEKSYYRRKLRNNTKSLNKLVDEVEEKLQEDKDVSVANTAKASTVEGDFNSIEKEKIVTTSNNIETPKEEIEIIDIKPPKEVIEPKKEMPKPEIVYETIGNEEERAREEIRKITESLIDAPKKESIENIALTKFEEEQEKNSIISIDELMASKELYDTNMLKEYEDENNVLISLNELEKLKTPSVNNNTKEKPTEVVPLTIVGEKDIRPNVVVEKKPSYTFKSSPIISPIYGFENKEEKPKDHNVMSLENSATYDKFDEEIRKTNEFLNTLKELQKKLD